MPASSAGPCSSHCNTWSNHRSARLLSFEYSQPFGDAHQWCFYVTYVIIIREMYSREKWRTVQVILGMTAKKQHRKRCFRKWYMLLHELVLIMYTGPEWERGSTCAQVLGPRGQRELLQSRKADRGWKMARGTIWWRWKWGEVVSPLFSILRWGRE